MARETQEAVEHVDLVRRYVKREITADDFVSDFLAARHRWIDALGNPSASTGAAERPDVRRRQANAYDDLREPDEFDDENSGSAWLAASATGTPGPT